MSWLVSRALSVAAVVIILAVTVLGVIELSGATHSNSTNTSTQTGEYSGTSMTQATQASSLTTGSITGTSTARTCTDIPNLSYMYCGGSLRISAVGQADGGTWNLTATVSSDVAVQEQTVQLVANLTNIGQNITLGEWVEPYINPSVNSANGTQVWAWDPSQITLAHESIYAGETISEVVNIPTSQLVPGQPYLVEVAPISLQFPTPNDLTFTFQLTVQ